MPIPAEGIPPLEERLEVGLALRKARKEAGLETAQAAERGGISVSTLGAIERGTHSLTSVSAGNLAKLPAAWGLTWEKFADIVAPVYGAHIPLLTSRPLTDAERRGGSAEAGVQLVNDLHRIPVRGLAAAGSAFYSDDNILDYEYVTADEYRVGMLAVQIEGDSMEPHVPHGSRVYVDVRLTDPQEGKMFLIHIHGDGFVVKRAKQVGHSWLLLSDNPAYQAFTPDEATVVGQVYFIQPRGWRA